MSEVIRKRKGGSYRCMFSRTSTLKKKTNLKGKDKPKKLSYIMYYGLITFLSTKFIYYT